jgi:hypothetical protein
MSARPSNFSLLVLMWCTGAQAGRGRRNFAGQTCHADRYLSEPLLLQAGAAFEDATDVHMLHPAV